MGWSAPEAQIKTANISYSSITSLHKLLFGSLLSVSRNGTDLDKILGEILEGEWGGEFPLRSPRA
jgi:hypothetical protein